jgi:hypothetical protein
MNRNRRPQRQKPAKVRQVQQLRQSNAAAPHKLKTAYNRKPKYGIDWGY